MEVHHILQKYQTPEGKSPQNKTQNFPFENCFPPFGKEHKNKSQSELHSRHCPLGACLLHFS